MNEIVEDEQFKSTAERVIVALDCAEAEALAFAEQLKGVASWVKVGMTLYYQAGPAIVAKLKDKGFKVFVDLKLCDIPHQVRGAAAALVHAGADMLTMHCSGGVAMLEAGEAGVIEAAYDLGIPKPITLGITVLTSMDSSDLADIGVQASSSSEQVCRLATLAKTTGLSGVVASAHEAKNLRTLLGSDAAIVTPGIRLASGIHVGAETGSGVLGGTVADTEVGFHADLGFSSNVVTDNSVQVGVGIVADNDKQIGTGDQKRVDTPATAIANGASYLVVGRPITQALDLVVAFRAIVLDAALVKTTGSKR